MFRDTAFVWALLLGSLLLLGCNRDAGESQPAAGDEVLTSTDAAADGGSPSDTATDPAGTTPQPLQNAPTQLTEQTPAASTAGVQDTADEPVRDERAEIMNRSFATLQARDTSDPQELLLHIREIDAAIQDLVLAASSDLLNEQLFTEFGMRLGKMKLTAGKKLAESPQSNPEQRQTGLISQLVALSHMSGLRDVESAKQLEKLAAELAQSEDPVLAHQSRVVLLGFEIQALQNGVRSDPGELIQRAEELISRPEDRNFPEFMVLQQAHQVLQQMGFEEQAQGIQQIIVDEYRQSRDPQLRGEAWLMEVEQSQAYQNFILAFQQLGQEQFDSGAAIAAVRGLYDDFPSLSTLEQIASTVPNIEYSGNVSLSQQMVEWLRSQLEKHADEETAGIENILADHTSRTAILGQPLQIEGLIGFDGQPIDWSRYEDKVVLVDFWATWCLPCLKELPTIRESYTELVDQGFEVVSINMDENVENARQFVEKQKFPWRTFHASDPSNLGFKSEFAQQLGINAIPFMVVIGRDGTVKNIHVRGEKLQPTVKNLLNES